MGDGPLREWLLSPPPRSAPPPLSGRETICEGASPPAESAGGGHAEFARREFFGTPAARQRVLEHRKRRAKSFYGNRTIGEFGSFVYLVNQIFGASLVAIPYVFKASGYVPCLLSNAFTCVVAAFAALMLMRAMTMIKGNYAFQQRVEYAACVAYFLGKKRAGLVQVSFYFAMQAMNVASIVVVSQAIDQLLILFGGYTAVRVVLFVRAGLQVHPTLCFRLYDAGDYALYSGVEIPSASGVGSSASADSTFLLSASSLLSALSPASSSAAFSPSPPVPAPAPLYLSITLGYIICACICIPLSTCSMEENMTVQYVSFTFLLVSIFAMSCSAAVKLSGPSLSPSLSASVSPLPPPSPLSPFVSPPFLREGTPPPAAPPFPSAAVPLSPRPSAGLVNDDARGFAAEEGPLETFAAADRLPDAGDEEGFAGTVNLSELLQKSDDPLSPSFSPTLSTSPSSSPPRSSSPSPSLSAAASPPSSAASSGMGSPPEASPALSPAVSPPRLRASQSPQGAPSSSFSSASPPDAERELGDSLPSLLTAALVHLLPRAEESREATVRVAGAQETGGAAATAGATLSQVGAGLAEASEHTRLPSPFGEKKFGQLFSSFVAGYSYVTVVPCWANEMTAEVRVERAVWVSSAFCCLIYFFFGLLLAAAYPNLNSDNVLQEMLSDPSTPLFAHVAIYIFDLFTILPGILVYCIATRYNLVNSGFCTRRNAFWIGVAAPFAVSWLLMNNTYFSGLLTWSSLFFSLMCNFIAPIGVYILACTKLPPLQRNLQGKRGKVLFNPRVRRNVQGAGGSAASADQVRLSLLQWLRSTLQEEAKTGDLDPHLLHLLLSPSTVPGLAVSDLPAPPPAVLDERMHFPPVPETFPEASFEGGRHSDSLLSSHPRSAWLAEEAATAAVAAAALQMRGGGGLPTLGYGYARSQRLGASRLHSLSPPDSEETLPFLFTCGVSTPRDCRSTLSSAFMSGRSTPGSFPRNPSFSPPFSPPFSHVSPACAPRGAMRKFSSLSLALSSPQRSPPLLALGSAPVVPAVVRLERRRDETHSERLEEGLDAEEEADVLALLPERLPSGALGGAALMGRNRSRRLGFRDPDGVRAKPVYRRAWSLPPPSPQRQLARRASAEGRAILEEVDLRLRRHLAAQQAAAEAGRRRCLCVGEAGADRGRSRDDEVEEAGAPVGEGGGTARTVSCAGATAPSRQGSDASSPEWLQQAFAASTAAAPVADRLRSAPSQSFAHRVLRGTSETMFRFISDEMPSERSAPPERGGARRAEDRRDSSDAGVFRVAGLPTLVGGGGCVAAEASQDEPEVAECVTRDVDDDAASIRAQLELPKFLLLHADEVEKNVWLMSLEGGGLEDPGWRATLAGQRRRSLSEEADDATRCTQRRNTVQGAAFARPYHADAGPAGGGRHFSDSGERTRTRSRTLHPRFVDADEDEGDGRALLSGGGGAPAPWRGRSHSLGDYGSSAAGEDSAEGLPGCPALAKKARFPGEQEASEGLTSLAAALPAADSKEAGHDAPTRRDGGAAPEALEASFSAGSRGPVGGSERESAGPLARTTDLAAATAVGGDAPQEPRAPEGTTPRTGGAPEAGTRESARGSPALWQEKGERAARLSGNRLPSFFLRSSSFAGNGGRHAAPGLSRTSAFRSEGLVSPEPCALSACKAFPALACPGREAVRSPSPSFPTESGSLHSAAVPQYAPTCASVPSPLLGASGARVVVDTPPPSRVASPLLMAARAQSLGTQLSLTSSAPLALASPGPQGSFPELAVRRTLSCVAVGVGTGAGEARSASGAWGERRAALRSFASLSDPRSRGLGESPFCRSATVQFGGGERRLERGAFLRGSRVRGSSRPSSATCGASSLLLPRENSVERLGIGKRGKEVLLQQQEQWFHQQRALRKRFSSLACGRSGFFCDRPGVLGPQPSLSSWTRPVKLNSAPPPALQRLCSFRALSPPAPASRDFSEAFLAVEGLEAPLLLRRLKERKKAAADAEKVRRETSRSSSTSLSLIPSYASFASPQRAFSLQRAGDADGAQSPFPWWGGRREEEEDELEPGTGWRRGGGFSLRRSVSVHAPAKHSALTTDEREDHRWTLYRGSSARQVANLFGRDKTQLADVLTGLRGGERDSDACDKAPAAGAERRQAAEPDASARAGESRHRESEREGVGDTGGDELQGPEGGGLRRSATVRLPGDSEGPSSSCAAWSRERRRRFSEGEPAQGDALLASPSGHPRHALSSPPGALAAGSRSTGGVSFADSESVSGPLSASVSCCTPISSMFYSPRSSMTETSPPGVCRASHPLSASPYGLERIPSSQISSFASSRSSSRLLSSSPSTFLLSQLAEKADETGLPRAQEARCPDSGDKAGSWMEEMGAKQLSTLSRSFSSPDRGGAPRSSAENQRRGLEEDRRLSSLAASLYRRCSEERRGDACERGDASREFEREGGRQEAEGETGEKRDEAASAGSSLFDGKAAETRPLSRTDARRETRFESHEADKGPEPVLASAAFKRERKRVATLSQTSSSLPSRNASPPVTSSGARTPARRGSPSLHLFRWISSSPSSSFSSAWRVFRSLQNEDEWSKKRAPLLAECEREEERGREQSEEETRGWSGAGGAREAPSGPRPRSRVRYAFTASQEEQEEDTESCSDGRATPSASGQHPQGGRASLPSHLNARAEEGEQTKPQAPRFSPPQAEPAQPFPQRRRGKMATVCLRPSAAAARGERGDGEPEAGPAEREQRGAGDRGRETHKDADLEEGKAVVSRVDPYASLPTIQVTFAEDAAVSGYEDALAVDEDVLTGDLLPIKIHVYPTAFLRNKHIELSVSILASVLLCACASLTYQLIWGEEN
ncbi:hypothetical protein BESB_017660 [Besnoitia besnoiti]|uniref:Transmembrane amino acid transporter n=1 Tax=Besnoitia besnoiti TaxID=94643 RepID=A0A2A9M1S2_BESBE|nr:hypothetical protein BESB_017660 [Besnoitia besnoiti]PFH32448.1 hypothetical protein BESB_017660 [Besnoitia besnoiti]